MRHNRRQSLQQKGITLIEVLLSLAVLASISYYLLLQQADTAKDLRAKRVAESMQDFSEVATNYLLANKDGVMAAADTGANASTYCVINADPSTGAGTTANNAAKHTCAVDVSFLKYKRVISAAYPDINEYKQKWTAIYRVVYVDDDNNAGTPDTKDGSIELLIVGATNGGREQAPDNDEVITSASMAGYNGGFIPNGSVGSCTYNATTKQACGSGGGWKVDLSGFVN